MSAPRESVYRVDVTLHVLGAESAGDALKRLELATATVGKDRVIIVCVDRVELIGMRVKT
jgi:hypothetical protein